MTEALVARYGVRFLAKLDLLDGRGGTISWAARIVRSEPMVLRQPVRGGHLLKHLLLAGLVTKDVRELYSLPEGDTARDRQMRLPSGYSSIRDCRVADATERERFVAAFHEHGSLYGGSRAVGLSFTAYVGALIAAEVRVPMPLRYRKTYGDEELDAIRADLRAGEVKKAIAEKHGISIDVLDRVVLDQPGLAKSHRASFIERTRIHHRSCVEAFLRDHPSASRWTIAEACVGSVDWLREYDHEWLKAFWPRKGPDSTLRRKAASKPRKPWKEVELDMLKCADSILEEMRRTDRKPYRITVTRVYRELGLSHGQLRKMPRLKAHLEANAETRDEVHRRRIKWAVVEYAKEGLDLNGLQFRRVSGLPIEIIRRYQSLIVFEAHQVQVPVDGFGMFLKVQEYDLRQFEAPPAQLQKTAH